MRLMLGKPDDTHMTLAEVKPMAVTSLLPLRPGVGFIGAGVIMRNQTDDKIHGLTTAAAVWITAALGALCGIGEWKIIVTLSAIVAVVLLTGGPIERWCDKALRNKNESPPP